MSANAKKNDILSRELSQSKEDCCTPVLDVHSYPSLKSRSTFPLLLTGFLLSSFHSFAPFFFPAERGKTARFAEKQANFQRPLINHKYARLSSSSLLTRFLSSIPFYVFRGQLCRLK